MVSLTQLLKQSIASNQALIASNAATQASNANVIESNTVAIAADSAIGSAVNSMIDGLAATSAKIDVLQKTLDAATADPPSTPGAPTIVLITTLANGDGTMTKQYGVAPQPLDVSVPEDQDVTLRVVTATNTTQGTPTQTFTITQPAATPDGSGPVFAPGLLLSDDAGAILKANAGDSIHLTDQVTRANGVASDVEAVDAVVVDDTKPPKPGQLTIQTVGDVA